MIPFNLLKPLRHALITMGDPSGIGPELICLAHLQDPNFARYVVIAGDVHIMQRAATWCKNCGLWPDAMPLPVACSSPDALDDGLKPESLGGFSPLRVWQACDPLPHDLIIGQIDATAGYGAAQCIIQATQWVLHHPQMVLVTAPIHKTALHLAGYDVPGHTELLQHLACVHQQCTTKDLPVRMMLSHDRLATVLLSIHVSLQEAIHAVQIEPIVETLEIIYHYFLRQGRTQCRVAVAGLNPHAGEGGVFGREEIDIIQPAIEIWKNQPRPINQLDMTVSSPIAPDTVFMRAQQGEFDVVLAMYHDQGLIAVKLNGLEHGVNSTLGLPFVRTSPDHGTAFDLAGQCVASPASLLAAWRKACQA